MKMVYVSIGNSDQKLTQTEWASFCHAVNNIIQEQAYQVHGEWYSLPDSRWVNACWCFEVPEVESGPSLNEVLIISRLRELAKIYNQDWITWGEAETREIKP